MSLLDTLFANLKPKARFTDEQISANPILGFLPEEQGFGSSLAQALPYLNYSKDLGKYYKPAQEYLGAMTDINNPKYQQIYGQQRQQGQDNLAFQIAELSRQNRKLSALGRTPLFDQERGGEQLFRGMTQGYQDVQNQAANNTQDILKTGYNGAMQMGAINQQNALNRTGVKSNMYGALSKLFGL